MSGIFSTTSLALLLVIGAVPGGVGFGAAAGLAGAAVYLVPGVAVLLALRYRQVREGTSRLFLRVAGSIQRWRPSIRDRLDELPAQLEEFLDRIASLRLPSRGAAGVFALAALNWAADCATLALAIHATGSPVPWHALLLAWGAGAAVGSTGLTPGGFGIVELTVAAALTAGGLPASGALASVLAYRVINFWLVNGAGGLVGHAPARCPTIRPSIQILKVGGGSISAELSLGELDQDPHAGLARLRAQSPVAWEPVLDGWLVTGYAEAVAVMRDSRTFTVDDPRFSTARVVGPSMLSLDGKAHARHRSPFFAAFHRGGAAERLPDFADAEALRLVAAIRPTGAADLRRELSGPLAVAVVAQALGLGDVSPAEILALYSRIVGGVTGLSGDQGRPGDRGEPGPQDTTGIATPDPDSVAAFNELAGLLRAVIDAPGAAGHSVLGAAAAGGELSETEIISDAAVVMFGGIDTTDGMIANAVLHLLGQPDQLDRVRADPGLLPAAVEESLRLEPAAAIVDRYATAGIEIGGAKVRAGDRVTVSLSGANRDPAVFDDPDRFVIGRPEADRHLAFAHGPHFCIGAPPARAETLAALRALLPLPGLRLDPAQPASPEGLVFRKPPTLPVLWD